MVRGKVVKQLREASADTTWITPQVIEGYTAGALADFGATLGALKGMARSQEPWTLASRLPEIRSPVVLVLGGEPHKHGPPDAEVQVLRDGVPGLIIDSVPGAGHYVFEEQPRAVASAIRTVEAAWMVSLLGR
jgi:pimeloyl-ACP methyl ester carboxylesterase